MFLCSATTASFCGIPESWWVRHSTLDSVSVFLYKQPQRSFQLFTRQLYYVSCHMKIHGENRIFRQATSPQHNAKSVLTMLLGTNGYGRSCVGAQLCLGWVVLPASTISALLTPASSCVGSDCWLHLCMAGSYFTCCLAWPLHRANSMAKCTGWFKQKANAPLPTYKSSSLS